MKLLASFTFLRSLSLNLGENKLDYCKESLHHIANGLLKLNFLKKLHLCLKNNSSNKTRSWDLTSLS